ncbi:unnamed protein product [Trichobilharzia szidati]|nr:unnamed protein product [Trichobilharzia szidati]
MASAAAAIAATVTGSANFFRLTKLKNKVDPQLQSGSLSSSSSSVTPASYLSTSSLSLRCIDQSRNLRLSSGTTDQMSSSVMVRDEDEEETELTGCLSTKEAVTMTSAAAAAAMVAAAATVAAEQHQLIGNNFLSEVG